VNEPVDERPRPIDPGVGRGAAPAARRAIASVDDLRIHFRTKAGMVHAVDGVSFDIFDGEALGLVGETGCGKSVTARSFLRLVPMPPGVHAGGRVLFRPTQTCSDCGGVGCERCARTGRVPMPCRTCDGAGCPACEGTGAEAIDTLTAPEGQLRDLRGNRIAMIFQDPGKALNPALSIGDQVAEVLYAHRADEILGRAGLDADERGIVSRLLRRKSRQRSTTPERLALKTPGLRSAARKVEHVADAWVRESLAETHIPDPRKIMRSYPHELSGGMKQRVMIAQALACDPELLIADEPTTALDVTIQARILDLIRELQERHRSSVLYISHDLSVVRRVCDRVAVMYAGTVVETREADDLFRTPLHPYTRGLLGATPSHREERSRLAAIEGTVPELIDPAPACRFHPRCPHAAEVCTRLDPPLVDPPAADGSVACFLYSSAGEVGVAPEQMPTLERTR
jgi:oligopeptide/dipeptide ABC transporter ATP-binding protein